LALGAAGFLAGAFLGGGSFLGDGCTITASSSESDSITLVFLVEAPKTDLEEKDQDV
jgi:hypothetical protein